MAPKEYYGTLHYLDSTELCLINPIVWYRADTSGGWGRLEIKLSLNNLLYKGKIIPSNPSAVQDTIDDLVSYVRAQGVEDFDVPAKAVTWTVLIKQLTDKGLIKPSTSKPVPAARKTDAEVALTANHHLEVQNHLASERSSAVPPMGYFPATEEDLPAPSQMFMVPQVNGPDQLYQIFVQDDLTDPQPGPSTGGAHSVSENLQSFTVLSKKHEDALLRIKMLESSAAGYKQKIVQLENSLATGNGILLSELKPVVSTTIEEALSNLELNIAGKIGLKVRAEITRANDHLVSQVALMPTLKSCSEAILNDTKDVKEILEELSESNTLRDRTSTQFVKEQFQDTKETVTVSKSMLNSMRALLSETLKKVDSTKTTAPPTLPLTPLSAPPGSNPQHRHKSCFDCGEPGHIKPDCPKRKKLDFCVRCLDPAHKFWECPHIHEQCQICLDNKRGALAYGHQKQIHFVTEKAKRDLITQVIPAYIFRDWAPASKRKASDM
eukprot:GFUD01131485.1.p1 GENE.GFUD01131485.1~~GFUD01131485.1.p1  ORF type:complete len:503 (-),score=87.45 GFUD01131485.1:80-1561(-)